jgi:ribose transport system permease protein
LCGLFIYRGISRFIAEDQVKGLGNQFGDLKRILYSSEAIFGLPLSLVYFLGLLTVATVFLHMSVHGRYSFAIGANEKAARYSGVPTDRYKILAYAMCSTFAAFYGVLYLMQENSAQPSSTGNFLELYAIAGAVLGGCSLRGGEGSVFGLVIGTSILVLLPNLSLMLGIPSALEYTVIGGALLLGAILDESLRRVGQRAA